MVDHHPIRAVIIGADQCAALGRKVRAGQRDRVDRKLGTLALVIFDPAELALDDFALDLGIARLARLLAQLGGAGHDRHSRDELSRRHTQRSFCGIAGH